MANLESDRHFYNACLSCRNFSSRVKVVEDRTSIDSWEGEEVNTAQYIRSDKGVIFRCPAHSEDPFSTCGKQRRSWEENLALSVNRFKEMAEAKKKGLRKRVE